jgi:hypothetical protein
MHRGTDVTNMCPLRPRVIFGSVTFLIQPILLQIKELSVIFIWTKVVKTEYVPNTIMAQLCKAKAELPLAMICSSISFVTLRQFVTLETRTKPSVVISVASMAANQ